MKLKFEVEIMEIDDESVAVPVGEGAESFHGVIKLNESGRFILEQLKEDTTEEKIVDAIMENYTCEREQVAAHVHKYVETLKEAELLEL